MVQIWYFQFAYWTYPISPDDRCMWDNDRDGTTSWIFNMQVWTNNNNKIILISVVTFFATAKFPLKSVLGGGTDCSWFLDFLFVVTYVLQNICKRKLMMNNIQYSYSYLKPAASNSRSYCSFGVQTHSVCIMLEPLRFCIWLTI